MRMGCVRDGKCVPAPLLCNNATLRLSSESFYEIENIIVCFVLPPWERASLSILGVVDWKERKLAALRPLKVTWALYNSYPFGSPRTRVLSRKYE
jgi:hypothetical protein